MAYCLDDGEALRLGLRRCAREQLDRAIGELTEGVRLDPVKAVHEARKALKQERSLLRLGRGTFRADVRRRENAGFRAAARSLGDSRDADVTIQALDELAERYAGQVPKRTFSAIRKRLERERAAARLELSQAGATEAVVDQLRSAQLRIDDWELVRGGWPGAEDGLLRSYRRGQKAAKRARREPTVENLHDWRKRAKDLWYHLRLLERMSPQVMHGHAQDAHRLSDLLGDDHDLAVLRQSLTGEAGRVPVDTDAVIGAIDHRREQLQSDAFLLADHLYAERPKSFRRRMRRYWTAWRAQTDAVQARRPAELATISRHAVVA